MSTETVTIMKDVYRDLVRSDLILGALEAAGVDNWPGYEEIVGWDEIDNEVERIINE
jgi:hypothetical protein